MNTDAQNAVIRATITLRAFGLKLDDVKAISRRDMLSTDYIIISSDMKHSARISQSPFGDPAITYSVGDLCPTHFPTDPRAD